MTAPTRLMTAEEFSARDERDDGCREELVAGVIEVAPPPGGPHGRIAARVVLRLGPFVDHHELGEVRTESGYRLRADPDDVRGPDVAFLSDARIERLTIVGAYEDGAPDLAVEVVSPNDRARKVQAKVKAYLAAGCRRVWLLYPESRSLVVYRDDGDSHTYSGGEVVTSDDAGFAVTGFEARVSEFFERRPSA